MQLHAHFPPNLKLTVICIIMNGYLYNVPRGIPQASVSILLKHLSILSRGFSLSPPVIDNLSIVNPFGMMSSSIQVFKKSVCSLIFIFFSFSVYTFHPSSVTCSCSYFRVPDRIRYFDETVSWCDIIITDLRVLIYLRVQIISFLLCSVSLGVPC